MLDLNLKAPFFLTRAFLPLLEEGATADDPARVINVGSIDGLHVPPMHTYSYSASKAGAAPPHAGAGHELGPQQITVNAIAPGAVRVEDDGARRSTRSARRSPPASPLGRIGRPDDMAGVAVFLASRAGVLRDRRGHPRRRRHRDDGVR